MLVGTEPVRFPLKHLCLGDLHPLGMVLDGFVDLTTKPAATFAPGNQGFLAHALCIRISDRGCNEQEGKQRTHQSDRDSLHGWVLKPRNECAVDLLTATNAVIAPVFFASLSGMLNVVSGLFPAILARCQRLSFAINRALRRWSSDPMLAGP
ncbi:hypothetical protein [Mesorhizobium sp. A556]